MRAAQGRRPVSSPAMVTNQTPWTYAGIVGEESISQAGGRSETTPMRETEKEPASSGRDALAAPQ